MSGSKLNIVYNFSNILKRGVEETTYSYVGQVIGEIMDISSKSNFTSVYYKTISNLPSIGRNTSDTVTSEDVVEMDTLPSIFEIVNGENCFKETNLGYPILKWEQ